MAHEEAALRIAAEIGAWSVAVTGAAVLFLAFVGEILRRARVASPVVALADRLLPTPSRRVAAAVLTVMSTVLALAVPVGARGDDRTRTWLEEPGAATTTTTTAPRAPSNRSTTTTSLSTTTSSTTSTTSIPTTSTPTTSTPTTSTPTTAVQPTPGLVAPVRSPRPTPVLRTTPPGTTHASVPVTPPAPSSPTTPAPPQTPTYTVVPDDCLWSIAAHVLGPRTTARAIDRGWRAIYAANVDAVGPDPNLIHPGLVLTLPPLDSTP